MLNARRQGDNMRHARWGVNLDFDNPTGKPAPDQLELFTWARLVARTDPGFQGYLDSLKGAGVQSIVVIARQSLPPSAVISLQPGNPRSPVTIDFDQVRAAVFDLAQNIHPDVWELGNEPDGTDASSFIMTKEQYRDFATACHDGIRAHQSQQNVRLIVGGLSSGDAAWLEDIWPLPVNGIGVHPYVQRPTSTWPTATWGSAGPPDDVWSLLDRYLVRYFIDDERMPLWITEFGTPDMERDAENEVIQDRYYRRMFDSLARREAQDPTAIEASIAFCWSDRMVENHGLFDEGDIPNGVEPRAKECYRRLDP
jgi:hypothetical protein